MDTILASVNVSPHRQEPVAQRYDEDKIVPCQLRCAITP